MGNQAKSGPGYTGTAPGMGIPQGNVGAPNPTDLFSQTMQGAGSLGDVQRALNMGRTGQSNMPGFYPQLPGLGQGTTSPQNAFQNFMNGSGTLGSAQSAFNSQGQQIPSEFLTPQGPVEQLLLQMLQGGPNAFASQPGVAEHFLGGQLGQNIQAPGMGFASQLAQGQIPDATRSFFEQELARQNAGITEGMRGARFGTDLASVLAREGGRSIANLGAQSEAQALGANNQLFNQGLSNQAQQAGMGQYLSNMFANRQQQALSNFGQYMQPALASEIGRQSGGFDLLMQEFLRQQGLPPDLAALVGISGIAPGGSTTNTGPKPNIAQGVLGAISGSLGGMGGGMMGGGGGGGMLAGLMGGGGGAG